jgi:iron(III) transport system substrate-binding protein
MERREIVSGSILFYLALVMAALHVEVGLAVAASAPSASTRVESLDELYEKAKKEGHVVVYMATSAKTEEVVFPAFEKRFSGIKVNHVNATADQLVTRAVAEARGGKMIADVISGTQNYITQLREQNMLLDIALPEAAVYPSVLKGTYWVATDTEFFIAAWNSSRLKKEDEPKTFEDFADAKWAKRLIAEPRDFQLLLGLAKYKYGSDEKAIGLFKTIAANKPEFFKGHSQLAELLAAGQADACMTCYAHHIPPMAKKGAPLQSCWMKASAASAAP